MSEPGTDPNERLLEIRRQLAEGGGAERVKTQHARGKKTARERVEMLLDAGSFQEMDAFMIHRSTDFGMEKSHALGDGLLAGFGKIGGKAVAVYAQDFTIAGGSIGEVAGIKMARIMDLAMQAGVPVIGLNDSGGARIQEGVNSLSAYGELFYRNTLASGVIPQFSLMLGPCAGGAVYSPALTDFIIMVRGVANMFITGPEVIKTVTGEEVDTETLGGAETHAGLSGVAHFAVRDEAEAFQLVKRILSYIPSNNAEPPPRQESWDQPGRMDSQLDQLVPLDAAQPYDMRRAIQLVMDQGSFLEVHAEFAQSAVVGFARLHGQSIGVVAQQPMVLSGVIDIDSSDKIARFVRFCDAFNLPLVTFADSPGFLPGTDQEHGGIIRHGAKIVYAYAEATVPKLTVITRKGYGGAYIVMGSKHLHADLVYAWPTAEIAVMGAEGAVNILHRKELSAAADRDAEKARLMREYKEKFANPYRAAAFGFVDEVILPSETRPRLIAALELLRDKQASLPARKHGCMPL